MKTYPLLLDHHPAFHYQLRRSERAKKTRIVVTADKVEVVAPKNVSEQDIKSFVDSQRHWIADAIKRVRHRVETIKPLSPAQYSDGVTVPFQGEQVPLMVKHTPNKRTRLQLLDGRQFLVYLPEHHINRSDAIKSALEKWMKERVRELAILLIEKHGKKHQLVARQLRIKTLKSRWGSCGPTNDINLNWLLILAPPVILEYVVIHELCHIKHKNHSKDFWALVGDHMPDYAQHRYWLKQHGASLMRGL